VLQVHFNGSNFHIYIQQYVTERMSHITIALQASTCPPLSALPLPRPPPRSPPAPPAPLFPSSAALLLASRILVLPLTAAVFNFWLSPPLCNGRGTRTQTRESHTAPSAAQGLLVHRGLPPAAETQKPFPPLPRALPSALCHHSSLGTTSTTPPW